PHSTDIDKNDECIVPADRQPIVDKEINGLLKELSASTHNIILIFDCCHSATMTRAANLDNVKTRHMSSKHLVKVNTSGAAGNRGAKAQTVPTAGRLSLPASSYVAFSACLAWQSEVETKEKDVKKHNGVLTRNMVNALKRARSNWSYLDLHNAICSAITA